MLKLDYIDFIPSPHKSARKGNQKPTWIVIHAMSGSYQGSIAWFKNPKSKVSAHYLVSKKGEMVCMVKPELKAWHVGAFNSPSVGIEFEDMNPKTKKNCMTDPTWFTDIELERGAELTATLMKKYMIPMSNVIGHNDPMLRKLGSDHSDPGPYFPWERFRALIKKYLEPPKETAKNDSSSK